MALRWYGFRLGASLMGSNFEVNEQPKHEVTIEKYKEIEKGAEPPNCSLSPELDQPQNCVSWFDAQAYCKARGAGLPTEEEWEYAARGPNSLVFPWGNSYDAEYAIDWNDGR